MLYYFEFKKAQYADGKLVGGIKPCASAFSGTQITVEDLFYNSSIRRNALRNSSEEFSKINETVSRYALHNYHVAFFLKRMGILFLLYIYLKKKFAITLMNLKVIKKKKK